MLYCIDKADYETLVSKSKNNIKIKQILNICLIDQYGINWNKWDHLLGTMSDTKLADLINCNVMSIKQRREKLNIPQLFEPPRKRSNIDWGKWDRLLGTITDTELAKLIGCAKSTVKKRRDMYNIESFTKVQKIDWDKYDHLIGRMSDRKIGELIGGPYYIGFRRRKKIQKK